MIRPILNINGTSAEELIEPRLKADRLIAELVETLKHATPNGRDYPGQQDRCRIDRELHYDRIKALRALQDALFQEALLIKQQEG